MKKADRKEKVREIINLIDSFLGERTDSYERCIEDLEEIQCHVSGSIDGLKDDIKNREAK